MNDLYAVETLSTRELQITALINEGFSYSDIGRFQVMNGGFALDQRTESAPPAEG